MPKNTIKFEIVTPERIVLKEDILQVSVPTKQGEITVLPKHIPLVAALMPGVIELVKSNNDKVVMSVSGGFIEDVFATLMDNRSLVSAVARLVLNQSFPDSLHTEILLAAGLDLEMSGPDPETGEMRIKDLALPRPRDSQFRERILVAYSFSCAVCGFNVWLGRSPVALEAAHIKWHQAGGPDQEDNGLLLCTLHHKLFDRGVFSIDQDLLVRVSENAHGGEGFEQWLARFHGQSIRSPERPQYKPKENYIDWHIREVFRGPAKYSAS